MAWNPATNVLKEEKEEKPKKRRLTGKEQQQQLERTGNIMKYESRQNKLGFFGLKKKTTIVQTKKGQRVITREGTLLGQSVFGAGVGGKVVGGITGLQVSKPGRKMKGLTKRDILKIYRFKNRLEKAKLRNSLERYKLLHKITLAKQQGKLLQPAMQILQRPVSVRTYPAYSTQFEQQDIDSAFDADIQGAGNDMWGGENYYDEQFYGEDYYSNEFDNDPLFQLSIKMRQGVSPLLW